MDIASLIKSHNIKLLILCFFNLVKDDERYFYFRSSYKESKFGDEIGDDDSPAINYGLSRYFGVEFSNEKIGSHIFCINKSKDVSTPEEFLTLIARRIQSLSLSVSTQEYNEAVIMGLFLPRGSADFGAQYYAVDIFRAYSTKKYLRDIFKILSATNAIQYLNLNFREFQPDFKDKGVKRNTQIRITLGWLWSSYADVIRDINPYKYGILLKNQNSIRPHSSRVGNFADRLLEYTLNILGESVSEEKLLSLRKQMGMVGSPGQGQPGRDYTIAKLATEYLPDECVGCKDVYDKKVRTFKLRNRDRYYFEIHHVIPFSAGKEHDQISNLVKLCPTCHRIMTKLRAEESLQKEIIGNIIKSSADVDEYVETLSGLSLISKRIDFVYDRLA